MANATGLTLCQNLGPHLGQVWLPVLCRQGSADPVPLAAFCTAPYPAHNRDALLTPA